MVVAGITSNIHMGGVPLTKEEGMIQGSIIKLNYIMTISESMIKKYILTISSEKKQSIKEKLFKKLE
ncbi:hypothetical protein COU54_02470 [Candidatus Pacearchaeota archaeon CG10_big_fil_rev_8_21_14_0_10_31_24]|nr:MAG: hypothetical protein COU54_02470 [Candidatus Pacearchaeota archaeon CG10_big_fil_rev_8_21_14_0_10_31_24]